MEETERALAALNETNQAALSSMTSLDSEVAALTQRLSALSTPIHELDERLKSTGLSQLTSAHLSLFAHDIGLGHLEPLLRDLSGVKLASISASELESRYQMPYDSACQLLLRAFCAEHHYESMAVRSYAPAEGMLAWTAEEVGQWLSGLSEATLYERLAAVRWSGAALVSASLTRVQEAAGMTEAQAAALVEMIEREREKAEDWTAEWSAEAPVQRRRGKKAAAEKA